MQARPGQYPSLNPGRLDPSKIKAETNIGSSVTVETELIGNDGDVEANVSVEAAPNPALEVHTSASSEPVSGLLNLITRAEAND